MFISYVEISGKEVFDKHGRPLGRPYDFLVKFGEAYPLFRSIVLVKGAFKKQFAPVSWEQVRKIDEDIHLNVSLETIRYHPVYENEETISVRNGILDQQVVDTYNHKVVRVNDMHLLRVGRDLRIAHVDVGFRSIVRRLGWEKFVDGMVKFVKPRAHYLRRENLISWKFVQPLDVQPKKGTIRLNVSQEDLAAIPPADFVDIMRDLDPPERIALFLALDFEVQVDVLNELDVAIQKSLMEELDSQTAIKFLEKMEPDEVADLLSGLKHHEARKILSMMAPSKARKIYSLLEYESDSAGGLMSLDYLPLPEIFSVEEAMKYIREADPENDILQCAFVLDDEKRPVGFVTFKDLLMSEPKTRISEIMHAEPETVNVELSAKEAAFVMDKYDMHAIPVVDDDGVMRGILKIDDILAFVIDEAWGERPGLL